MKLQILQLFTNAWFVFTLLSQSASASVFTPNIKNYGVYKEVHLQSKQKLSPLIGHVPPEVNTSKKLGSLKGNKILPLSIVLPLNNEDELDSLLLDITDPNSPNYRHFLSQSEFISRFAPTKDQVDQVTTYLSSQGLRVGAVDPNNLIIHVQGRVSDINTIFHTELSVYMDASGSRFFAPSYEVQVDSSLNIQSVQGLDNRVLAHPNHIEDSTPAQDQGDPGAQAGPSRGLTPAKIKSAYSLNSTLDGTGQTLAVFELDGYTSSDITAYENAFNLPHVPLKNILVDGASGSPGGGASEVTLDIELMIALAPNVKQILVYEGPNSSRGTIDTFNRIATDNLAKSISTSWGATETSPSGSTLQAENTIFKQMAAQGQTLFAASGDHGAYDNRRSLSVQDPASQPFVVGVGGTRLTLNSDGTYQKETTWANGTAIGNSGGGGGISTIWNIPSWQQGVVSAASKGSTTHRNVPDVSLDSDPGTGYAIYYRGRWTVYGGTSCAAPLWAAFTALVNQERAANGLAVLGFPNPTLYQLGKSSSYSSTFHDIKDGSTNLFYPAVVGYDDATGWGTFVGDNLLKYLAGDNSPTPCTHQNPSAAISPSSQNGQPGESLSYSLTITNNDDSSCGQSSFNLAAAAPEGFTSSLSASSLALAPGASGTITLQLTSDPATSPGAYDFVVAATNSTHSSSTASATGTYVVDPVDSSPAVLTLFPQQTTFASNSNLSISYVLMLTDQNQGVGNTQVSVRISGPASQTRTVTTGLTGFATFSLLLNSSLPAGTYTINATSQVNGKSVSGTATLILQ